MRSSKYYNCSDCPFQNNQYMSCNDCLRGQHLQAEVDAKYIRNPTPEYSYWDY